MRHGLIVSAMAAGIVAWALGGCYPKEWVTASPDGKWLLYSRIEEPKGLFITDADGQGMRRLATAAWCPKFSPDGKQVLYMDVDETTKEDRDSTTKLMLLDVAAGSTREVASWANKEKVVYYVVPSWRPGHASQCAYVLWRVREDKGGGAAPKGPSTELHLLDFANGKDDTLAENVSLECAWSGDGNRLAFLVGLLRDDGGGRPISLVRVWNDGGKAQDVALVAQDDWSSVVWLGEERLGVVTKRGEVPMGIAGAEEQSKWIAECDLATGTVGLLARGDVVRVSPASDEMVWQTLQSQISGPGEEQKEGMRVWWMKKAGDRKQIWEGVRGSKVGGESSGLFWAGPRRVGWFVAEGKVLLLSIGTDGEVAGQKEIDLEAEAKALAEKEAPAESAQSAEPATAESATK